MCGMLKQSLMMSSIQSKFPSKVKQVVIGYYDKQYFKASSETAHTVQHSRQNGRGIEKLMTITLV